MESSVLFTMYGLKSVRMDDIAANMGISKRTIYELFGDKETLIEAAIHHFFDQKRECDIVRCGQAGNIIEKIFIGLSGAEDAMQQSFVLMSDLKKFYPKIHQRFTEESFDKGTEGIREAIETGVNGGLIVDVFGADLPVKIFVSFMECIHKNISTAATAAPAPFAEMVRSSVLIFVRGLATLKGIEMIDKYMAEKYYTANN